MIWKHHVNQMKKAFFITTNRMSLLSVTTADIKKLTNFQSQIQIKRITFRWFSLLYNSLSQFVELKSAVFNYWYFFKFIKEISFKLVFSFAQVNCVLLHRNKKYRFEIYIFRGLFQLLDRYRKMPLSVLVMTLLFPIYKLHLTQQPHQTSGNIILIHSRGQVWYSPCHIIQFPFQSHKLLITP